MTTDAALAPLADQAHALMEAALAAGADAADALILHGTALSIDVRQGALEQAERAEGTDAGLRVLVGQRQACVSASDTTAATFQLLAERAVAMAREAPEDASLGLATKEQIATTRDAAALDLVDNAAEPDAAWLEKEAHTLEEAALAHAGITQVEASASHARRALFIAQSNGFAGGRLRTSHARSLVAYCGAGDAMERDFAAEERAHGADLPSAAIIGDRAATRALARLGARKPPTGSFPVLYDERVAASLIGHLLSAINGGAIARGASWARDLLGEAVLPSGMALIEDPLRPRGPASRVFDAEGLPTARREIVRDGRLQGWILDLGTARRLGLRSTANARRGPASPPAPGTTNIELAPGDMDRAALLRTMGRGLLVTALMGATINPNTGDYSRGATGFWIEGGEISHPVHECTLAGNLRDMLAHLIPANDARPERAMRVPSLLIERMTIAGA